MHKDWEQIQLQRKLKLKKKVTVPQEFRFSSSNNVSSTLGQPHRFMQRDGNENVDRSNRTVATKSLASGKPSIQLKPILKKQPMAPAQPLNSSNSTRFAAAELRRKSLGPPRRTVDATARVQPDVSSSSNDINLSRRKSLAMSLGHGGTTSKPAEMHVDSFATVESSADTIPMSKLERRISTYFSKEQSLKKTSSSVNPDVDLVLQPERIETRLGQTLMEVTGTPAKNVKSAPNYIQDDQEWMKQLAQNILKRTTTEKLVNEEAKCTIAPADDSDRVEHPVAADDAVEESLKPKDHEAVPVQLDLHLISELMPTPPPPIVDKSAPATQTKIQHITNVEAFDTTSRKTASKINSTEAEIYQIGYKEQLCDDDDMTFKLPVPRLLVPVDHDVPREKSIYQLKRSQAKLFQNVSAESPLIKSPDVSMPIFSVPTVKVDHPSKSNTAENTLPSETSEALEKQTHEDETTQFYFDATDSQFDIQRTINDFVVPLTPLALSYVVPPESSRKEFLTPFKTALDGDDLLISSPDVNDQHEIMKQLQNLQLLEEELMKDLEAQKNIH